jgi:hypothetical protein
MGKHRRPQMVGTIPKSQSTPPPKTVLVATITVIVKITMMTLQINHAAIIGAMSHSEARTPAHLAQIDAMSHNKAHTPAHLARIDAMSHNKVHTPAHLVRIATISHNKVHTPAHLARIATISRNKALVHLARATLVALAPKGVLYTISTIGDLHSAMRAMISRDHANAHNIIPLSRAGNMTREEMNTIGVAHHTLNNLKATTNALPMMSQ